MTVRILLILATLLLVGRTTHADETPYKIGKFPQEIAVKVAADAVPLQAPKGIALTADGAVVVYSDAGTATWQNDAWSVSEATYPAFHAVLQRAERSVLATDAGLVLNHAGTQQTIGLSKIQVNDIALGKGGRLAVAAANGLYEERPDGAFEVVVVEDGMGRRWATSDVRAVTYDSLGQLWFGTLAGVGCREEGGWKFYTGAEGLPYNDFTCAAAGPDGTVWFGTTLGAVRFDGKEWAYRQGKRWLPGDHVIDMAVDAEGRAWFVTDGGVGRIEHRMMTLTEKAKHYEDEINQYIKRTPFGYTSEVGLKKAGDKSEILYADSDNDGLWTAMYGASQAFAYAVTKSDQHKADAKQAFEALRQLQKVTQGGEHAPPLGYVARTILPTDAPDPNVGRIEGDIEKKATEDSLWKIYEPRWPKSADGQWYWKSDTSSDELDGHYFFYPAYYEHVADTEEEKERVREVVRDLTNHIMDHGFILYDHDGTPTRWSIYDPQNLNYSKHWWSERGLKSLSMISYLTVAEHITGDAKYGEAAKMLRDQHAYATNAMVTKVQFGVGSGNQSDDEMAIMCYYNLIKYTKDGALRDEMVYSFYQYWLLMQPEMNPFFHFAYAACGIGAKYTNPWGTFPIGPWDGWLTDSMATLTGFPLDRVGWSHKNSHRLDIVPLNRQTMVEPYQEPETGRGHRVNGKVLPVENRHFNHGNTDPWRLDYGGNGHDLASGTVYLLPYWMGRYHKFIEETE